MTARLRQKQTLQLQVQNDNCGHSIFTRGGADCGVLRRRHLASNLGLLRQRQRIIRLDPEVSDCALQLGVPKQ